MTGGNAAGESDADDRSTSQPLSWSSKNYEITYEQGKRVLAAQKEDINQIDDKALRTVRITALVIGVGATGLQAISDVTVNKLTASIAGLLLFLSLSFGVMTYNESSEIVGPTAEYLERMRDGHDETDWETDLLVQFPGWISRNQEKVERNALLFNFCQLSLVSGVGFGAASLLQVGTTITALLLLAVVVILIGGYWLARCRTARKHPNS